MNNPRITAKDRGLIKGAIRRVFSRSQLRIEIVKASVIPNYHDPERPRVGKWSICPSCNKHTPTYLLELDHLSPIVPTNKTLEDMSWDELINNLWCESNNLAISCKPCHKGKSLREAKERRLNKKKRGT